MSDEVEPDVPEPGARAVGAAEGVPAGEPAEVAEVVPEEQIAFDINDFPGGARSAIEAVLMVVDQPISEVAMASALELPLDDVVAHLHACLLYTSDAADD